MSLTGFVKPAEGLVVSRLPVAVAKRVYFCFHYQDVIDFRANVVRNPIG